MNAFHIGMRDSIAMESSNPYTDDGRLLVMGYRGTLRAAIPSGSGFPRFPDESAFLIEDQPPIMESLLEPWLTQASQLLNQRVPKEHLVFQGEPVPFDSLLLLFKDRLIGVLTQAVGTGCVEADVPLAPPPASDILRDFPLLVSLIRSAVSEWVSAILIFLQRLHRDQPWMAAALHWTQLPPIEAISGTASDAHAGGHSVLRVGFRGGGCLYYKPRPVTGEWLWHELLETMARVDPQLRLPAAGVFTRDTHCRYGWAQSVFPEENRLSNGFDEGSTISSPGTVDYWRAAGAMLCLAQFARLTDLHLGNIVATPWGPVVTDAECLATPNLPVRPGTETPLKNAAITDALESIVGTGLLPGRRDRDQPDVSGLFGRAAPLSGIRLPAWSRSPEGRYHLISVGAELVAHHNVPSETSAIAVLPQILSGYRHAAELLIRGRKTLLGPGAQWRVVLEKLHAPRIVVRDTLTYGLLMSRSLEPQYLHSSYRRRNAILSGLVPQPGQDLPQALLRTETNALLQLHIPRLTILPGSRTLATGSRRAIARGFTASAPAQTVLGQIERLSTDSIDNVHVPALLSTIL